MKRIHKYVQKNNISLDLVPTQHCKIMQKRFRISRQQHRYALDELRKSLNIKKKEPKQRILKSDAIQNCLLERGLVRGSNKQGPASKTIIHALDVILPRGGNGLLIGTPGPLFTGASQMNNNNIIVDELFIAIFLEHVTGNPIEIVIGNAHDEIKAMEKASDWKAIDMLHKDTDIKLDVVHRDSFNYYVTKFTSRYTFTKVVLLTGGIWECNIQTARKHNLDLSYADPVRFLTSKFANLHVLALCRKGTGFCVKYVHNGKEEVIEPPKTAYKNHK